MGRLILATIHRNKGQQMRSRQKKSSKTGRELGGRLVQDLPNCTALKNLSEKINNVKQFSSEACIFKVSEELRKTNSQAYTPLTISIGPYHYHHRKMERLKELYTQSFLNRAQGGVEECWKKLKDLQGKAESYYGDLDDIKFVDDDEFVKMLLLDGCFIVEFVIRSCLHYDAKGQAEDIYDPIFKISGMEDNIVRDMLLLENQLPFFILQELYNMISNRGNSEFSEKVKIAFRNKIPKMNIKSLLETKVNPQGIKHLLQEVHILCEPQNNGKIPQQQQQQEACSPPCQPQNNAKILQQQQQQVVCSPPCQPQPQGSGSDIESHSLSNRQDRHRHWRQFLSCFLSKFWEQPQQSKDDDAALLCSIRTASELQEAGVDFKKVVKISTDDSSNETISLFDIKFNNHGVLEIPSSALYDPTETFFRNLIAYEQHSPDVNPMYFTDYAKFMDDLINTEKDVNLLRLKNVFVNGLGDDKEVTRLFNDLCKGITYSSNNDFYYKDVYKELNRHCEKPWNVLKARLRRDYFHTPWAGISTLAAILLLTLTIAQTVLSALGLQK
ncbi:uncharacterized protein LOC116007472 [Ipomoea triloba]|uniref:uncharacterized protein LOC116007472 n=1 Tax=Ipomoea triloba TaxID=35885 RepID=UPI00125E6433|nr:uncharacterized protein LOC116007472 [Ipomoea triloba]XP_031104006.1 uncharacterized protein LOC116007472 [Ipomoea triloba]